jgi:succinylglutamate desuccinylase
MTRLTTYIDNINKRYLEKELNEIDSGKAKMISEEEFWASTDKTLSIQRMKIDGVL